MKNRHGFVSNSSSSSFVLIGYKLDGKIEEIVKKFAPEIYAQLKAKCEQDKGCYFEDELHDFLNSNFIEGITYLSDDGPGYLGRVLSQMSSEDCSFDSVTLTGIELSEVMERVQADLEMDEPPSLIIGTRCT